MDILLSKSISQTSNFQKGQWTDKENLIYAIFLEEHRQMYSQRKRKHEDFFQEMTKFVKSRSAVQCRCHHQKLYEKFKVIQKVINHFKSYFKTSNFKQLLEAKQRNEQVFTNQSSVQRQKKIEKKKNVNNRFENIAQQSNSNVITIINIDNRQRKELIPIACEPSPIHYFQPIFYFENTYNMNQYWTYLQNLGFYHNC